MTPFGKRSIPVGYNIGALATLTWYRGGRGGMPIAFGPTNQDNLRSSAEKSFEAVGSLTHTHMLTG